MENRQKIIGLVLKAVALAMGVVSIVLGFLPDAADRPGSGSLAERRITRSEKLISNPVDSIDLNTKLDEGETDERRNYRSTE